MSGQVWNQVSPDMDRGISPCAMCSPSSGSYSSQGIIACAKYGILCLPAVQNDPVTRHNQCSSHKQGNITLPTLMQTCMLVQPFTNASDACLRRMPQTHFNVVCPGKALFLRQLHLSDFWCPTHVIFSFRILAFCCRILESDSKILLKHNFLA